MGFLKSWSEWVALKEDNARKRAVRDALAGTKPPLPGSYAACPSTNPRAMKQAAKTGVVSSDSKKLKFEDNGGPDYSFDRWIKKAEEFGDDVNKMVGHAKDEEEGIDKDLSKKKDQDDKKPVVKPEDSKPKDEEEKPKDTAWEKLKQKHQEDLDTVKKPVDPKQKVKPPAKLEKSHDAKNSAKTDSRS